MRHCSASATFPQVSQNRTLSLTSTQDRGEPFHVDNVGVENVERQTLGALRTDPGQSPELVDEVLNYAFVHLCLTPRLMRTSLYKAAGERRTTSDCAARPPWFAGRRGTVTGRPRVCLACHGSAAGAWNGARGVQRLPGMPWKRGGGLGTAPERSRVCRHAREARRGVERRPSGPASAWLARHVHCLPGRPAPQRVRLPGLPGKCGGTGRAALREVGVCLACQANARQGLAARRAGRGSQLAVGGPDSTAARLSGGRTAAP